MPSAFDTRFKRSGATRLLRHFGESVVYRPRAGGKRPVDAIIERNPPAFYDAAGNVVMASFIVRLKHDKTEGVLASDVDTGGDQIELIAEVGDASRTLKTIDKLVSQDSSVVVLAVR